MKNIKVKTYDRLGTKGFNSHGSEMIIDEYNYCKDIWVRFTETNNRVNTTWEYFSNGNVRNVYDRSVYGVGYVGEGEYVVSINKKYSAQYLSWTSMLQRCYGEKYQKTRPTYKGCTVVEEWHNFQNFSKWYDDNFYEIDGEKMCLDKDILSKNNKIYSPENCIFVPSKINVLFTKSNSIRGKYPIGAYFMKGKKYEKHPFRAQCSNGNKKQVGLGYFTTPEEAFNIYKTFKESLIKQIAEKYRDKIPNKLYDALMNYQVEITD